VTLKLTNKDGLSPVKPSATAMGFLHLNAGVALYEALFPPKGYRPGRPLN